MPGLYTPSSQAGIQSFYDAPSKGPKLNPKIILVIIVVFAVAVLVVDHFLFA